MSVDLKLSLQEAFALQAMASAAITTLLNHPSELPKDLNDQMPFIISGFKKLKQGIQEHASNI
jgi:hypothetical protein